MADAYCTKDDVHERLPDLSRELDSLLGDLCDAATALFYAETGRRFNKTSEARYFYGSGTDTLDVPELAAFTLVRVRTSLAGSWREVPITPHEGYRYGDLVTLPTDRDSSEPMNGIRFLDTGRTGPDSLWPQADLAVEITGDWGWAAVPSDVKDATVELVVALLRDRGVAVGGGVGISDTFIPGRPRTYPDITYRVIQKRRWALVA